MVTPHLQQLIQELSTENDIEYLDILLQKFNEQVAITLDDRLKRDLQAGAREVDKRIKALLL